MERERSRDFDKSRTESEVFNAEQSFTGSSKAKK